MVGSSYATNCNCHDYFDLGFKYPVDSIVIISNNTFQSNPPGTNLAPKFKGQFTRYDSLTGNPVLFILPLTQLIDSLNKYPRYNTIEMFTSPGIMPVKDQRFSYRVYVNGKTLVSVSTQIVHWF